MMGDIERWEFQFAQAAEDMCRPSIKEPTTFSEKTVMEMLARKVALANITLVEIVSKGVCQDPIAGSKKIQVLLSLSEYCVIVNLAVLGLKRAVKALEMDRFLESMPFPKTFELEPSGSYNQDEHRPGLEPTV
jgi:hypothetical protein